MKVQKKLLSLLLISLLCHPSGWTQVRMPAGKLDANINPGGQVAEISEPIVGVKGTRYLSDDWQVGNIYISSGVEVSDLFLRYDLQRTRLELNTASGIRVVPSNDIDYFEMRDSKSISSQKRKFVHFKFFEYDLPLPTQGFFEVLNPNEENQVLIKHGYKIQDAYYVPALDAGNKEAKIYKTEDLYLKIDGKVKEVPRKKKEIFTLFGKKASQIEKHAKQENFNPRHKDELVQLVKHYNELTAKD